MPKFKKRTLDEHLDLYEYLKDHAFKEAAGHFSQVYGRHISEDAVRTWSSKAAREFNTVQTALNRLRTLQRISARVRKISTVGGVKKEEEEEVTQF